MAKICNGYVYIGVVVPSSSHSPCVFELEEESKVNRYHHYQSHFLDSCFLCKRRLDSNDDIYMYKGEMSFCSEECREELMEIDQAGDSRRSKKLHTSMNVSAGTTNSVANFSVATTGAVVA